MSTGSRPATPRANTSTSGLGGSPTSLGLGGRSNRRHGHAHRLSSSSQQDQDVRPPQRPQLPQRQTLTRSFSHPPIVVLPPDDPVPSRRNLDISESSRARATSEEDPRIGSSELPGGRQSKETTRAIISNVMARYRAGSDPPGERAAVSETDYAAPNLTGYPQDQMPTIRLIPHQDPRSNRPSLAFPPTSRTLPHEDCVIRVGRYSERDTNPNPPPNLPSSAPVGFKSKVVSRRHCEFWCSNGQWYVKDVKSSSGTFLNHIRLSQPSMESKPFPVNDGDVVQLGIDFRGGEEMIFRCVKIRVECNRAWQKSLNNFNTTTHKRLRELAKSRTTASKDSDASSAHSSECSICLMSIAPCQSLFVAPCSHVWHYKCIRPILNDHKTYPQFLCPNCRAVADLEADVDDPNVRWEEDDIEEASKIDNDGANAVMMTPEASANDEALASSTARLLSIRNGTDNPSLAIGVPQIPLSASADQPSLLSRRNFANSTPFSLGPDFAQSMAQSNYLRPSTPSGSFMPEDGLTPNSDSASIPTIEMLRDGPMTPTNDAGPFVFDGSAGRGAAAQNVGSLS